MRPLREPYKSIECFTPKEFVSMWTKYTEKICLGKSHVYIQETEKSDTTNSTHPPGGLLPGYSNVFNQVRVFFRNRFRWHQYNAQLSPITCCSQTPVLIFIRCSNIHIVLDRQIDGWKWIQQTSGIGCQQHCIVCYHIGLSPIFIPLHHTDNFFSEVSISSLSFDNLDHVSSDHRCKLRIWRQGIIVTPKLSRDSRVPCWSFPPSVSSLSSAGRLSVISMDWNFSNQVSSQTAMKVVWWGKHS